MTGRLVAFLLLTCAVVGSADDLALQVSVVVPARHGERRIDAYAATPARHFHVLLGNRSASPLRVWVDTFSWGYYALSFEATDAAGRTFEIRKNSGAVFTRNIPAFNLLAPGEETVLDVPFGNTKEWTLPKQALPAGCTPVRLRAVFFVSPDVESEKAAVWTGRAVSPELAVHICR